jgi:hypothetical protein
VFGLTINSNVFGHYRGLLMAMLSKVIGFTRIQDTQSVDTVHFVLLMAQTGNMQILHSKFIQKDLFIRQGVISVGKQLTVLPVHFSFFQAHTHFY